jgi:SNF2 family DNA or RNA helicase
MQIVDNFALRFAIPKSDASYIKNHIAKCEVLNENATHEELLVYWGLKESQLIQRILGDEVPCPMNREYKWAGLYKPFDHQKKTAEFLALRERAFCFNEAGTGKTSSVVWAADYLMQQGLVKRVLVLCPLSIMYTAWRADVFNSAPHRTVAVAHGSADKRKKIINGSYEFVIINYDGLATVEDEVSKLGFDLIVVDEANAYKTVTTKRWKTLNRILKPSTRLWMLTGTPASQSPVDAFGLARMVAPHNVPRYTTVWRDMVMYQVSRFKWLPKPNAKVTVHRALQPAIRYEKRQCLDLPEILYQTRVVALTDQVIKYYKRIKEQMLVEAAGETITAVNAGAMLNKLLQISGGAVYTDTKQVLQFDVSPRLSALLETVQETDNKVLVFVPYTHTIELVSQFLSSKGVSNEVINGDVSAKKRGDIIDRFQSQEHPRVLVIQPQAASHGVTLTAADTVVFWSPVMSVETYLQCIARIERVGQKNNMLVVHIQGSEVERKLYQMLQTKVDLHAGLVDLYKQEMGIE